MDPKPQRLPTDPILRGLALAAGRDEPSDRRSFLRAVCAGAVSGALAGSVLPSVLRAECELTSYDILGPYWVEDAPWRTVLASSDEPGTRLFVRGRVFADDCATPLEGTIVDVWHATDSGCYSAVGDECPDEDPMNLRGQMLTDVLGRYAYETILPGYYPGRCKHIHLRIVPPEGDMLVTQLYFEGDPRIPEDPFASRFDALPRIIPLVEDEHGALHGELDIHLGTDAPTDVDPQDRSPTRSHLYPGFPNPFVDRTTIRFQTPADGPVELSIFDLEGRRIRRLSAGEHAAGYHTVVWDGRDEAGRAVASGTFLCRMEARSGVRTRKLLRAR